MGDDLSQNPRAHETADRRRDHHRDQTQAVYGQRGNCDATRRIKAPRERKSSEKQERYARDREHVHTDQHCGQRLKLRGCNGTTACYGMDGHRGYPADRSYD